ncbi:MAG: hypothetical protein IH946_12795, partial [Bacteroidetes bacterium]|nr:hypothetical protein [Bacteroidota bacterium]
DPPWWMEEHQGVLGELDMGEEEMELRFGQWINAGNLSIRKDVLLDLGGYNPCNAPKDKLVGDGEVGLSIKVFNNGGKIMWAPKAFGWHMQDASIISKRYMQRRAAYNGKSAAYTAYRMDKGKSGKMIGIMIRELGVLLEDAVKIAFNSIAENKKYYIALFDLESRAAIIGYLWEIMTDSKLRDQVMQEDWINLKVRPGA